MTADNSESREGLGEPVQPLGIRDVRMLARAIREDWPMSGTQKREVIEKAMESLREAETPRDIARLVAALVSADRANIAAAKEPATHQHLHLHDRGEQPQASQQIDDPDYIEFVSSRLEAGHKQPGVPGLLGDAGALAPVPARSVP